MQHQKTLPLYTHTTQTDTLPAGVAIAKSFPAMAVHTHGPAASTLISTVEASKNKPLPAPGICNGWPVLPVLGMGVAQRLAPQHHDAHVLPLMQK
jgi:hypothetical protein